MGNINVVKGKETITIDESQLPAAIDQGFHPEGQGELEQRARNELAQDMYGGALGTTAAAIASAERGATAGLSDPYMRNVAGASTAHQLEQIKETHPTVSTVGEIAGAIAPTLVSGGLATPAGLANAAGHAIAAGGERTLAR